MNQIAFEGSPNNRELMDACRGERDVLHRADAVKWHADHAFIQGVVDRVAVIVEESTEDIANRTGLAKLGNGDVIRKAIPNEVRPIRKIAGAEKRDIGLGGTPELVARKAGIENGFRRFSGESV